MKHFTISNFKQIMIATSLFAFMSASSFAQEEWEEVFFYDLTNPQEVEAGTSFTDAVTDIPLYTDDYGYWSFKNSGYPISNVSSDPYTLTYQKGSAGVDGEYFAIMQELVNGTYRLSINSNNWYPPAGETFDFFYTNANPSSAEKTLIPEPFSPGKNTIAATYTSEEFTIAEDGTYYLGVAPSNIPYKPSYSFADFKLERLKGSTNIGSVNKENIYFDSASQTIFANGGDVKVYDLSGRLVIKANNAESLNVSSLSNGIYTAVVGNTVMKFNKN